MRHLGHFEEADIGKVFDLKVVLRLFQFMRPYLKYLIAATVFLIVAAGVEIIYPYITKIAIDDYIIKSGKKITDVPAQEGLIKIGENQFFAPQLNKIDVGLLRKWEKENKISKEQYYYTFTSKLEKKGLDIVSSYPQLFEKYDSLIIISYSNFKNLKPQQIATLRARDIAGIVKIVTIFLILLCIGGISNYGQIYLSQYAGQLFMHSLRSKIFEKLQALHIQFFDRNPVGRLVTRATNDVEAINEAFTQVFARFLKDILLLIGIIVIMISMNLRLALIAFTVIPLLVSITFYFRIRARKIYRWVRIKLAKLNATLQENLSGIRIIKIFNREKDNLKMFDRVNEEYLEINLKQVLLMSFFRPLIEIISSLGIGLVLYFGGGDVITGKVSLGILVAFISYVEMFFRPIRQLTESYTLLQSAMASSERIFLLLDEEIKIRSKERAVKLEELKGEIEFKNVWFRYDDEWVLKDVSFKVAPGERIAIVGPTGAGKTSIINLISRLYEIEKGNILIDGIDIRDIRLSSLRSKIGVVPQDIFLFSGDIKSNIRLNLALEDNKVKEIASYINADRFIDRFPQKYDEYVAERGVTFSAGERQLLSFARALAFDPKILILDEATANIDAETERLIQNGLKKLLLGRTAIIIAHRLSTVKEVDRIYVLHKGEIKEKGTHEELIKKGGIYYNLYQLQSLNIQTRFRARS